MKARPGVTRVGWIGTGVMGSSMCGHLLATGFSATVFNRTMSKAQMLIDKGAVAAMTPKEVRNPRFVVGQFVFVSNAQPISQHL
jgi:3-hydroxyisobutyrate dehydrogenase